MALTFGQAKETLSQYQGVGGNRPREEDLNLFTWKILQYMLFSGSYGAIRKFTFHAVKGCFTAPFELETPTKVKINNKVGNVWSRWFEYHSSSDLQGPAFGADALVEDPNRYCTVYDIPAGGARVGVIGTCAEAEDATIIIHGIDIFGREVFTSHDGESMAGELLRIRKNDLRYSTTIFRAITAVYKPITRGYVQLYWVAPTSTVRGLLADYSPVEEVPEYRRFTISAECPGIAEISVLGNIRLKPAYADNDKIPFENLYAIELAGQGHNAQHNGDVQTAQAKDTVMQDMLARENTYKRPANGQPIECEYVLSAGSIKNIIR